MKMFQIIGIAFLFFVTLPYLTLSQDIIYKKDTTAQKVNIKNNEGKIITYRIPGDTLGTTYYLSKSLVDSLKFSDGKTVDLTNSKAISELREKKISRNYFSTEMVNLLTDKPSLEYERISRTGSSGIVAGLLINFRDNTRENLNWNEHPGILHYYNSSPYYFFIRFGVTLYPFNHSLIMTSFSRLSTGFSLLMGSYRKTDYSTYTFDGNNYIYSTHPVMAASFMWNIKGKIYLSDHLQITAGLEISALPLFAFFCPQVSFSVSF
jgi:hypothetical protein